MSRTRYHDRHYHRNGSRSFGRQLRGFRQRRAAGWGMNLYRNTQDGKVAGVSAGLADHLDIAHWVVRLLWIAGFLFTGTLALWAYVGAWILLAPRPRRYSDLDGELPPDDPEPGAEVEMEYDERHHHYRPRKVFRYSESASVRLRRARERLDAALQRVEAVESYVTSRQYELNKEISRL